MIYDVLVIGGGPAGGTAALYAARSGRSTGLLAGPPGESLIAGAAEIENYPGLERISGVDLLRGLQAQCRAAGVSWEDGTARQITVENRVKRVLDDQGREHSARALILAMGTRPIRPAIPGLDRFWGRGVSVCAWCDGAFFRGKRVAIFGGGNTAFASAALLARLAAEVHLLLPKRSGKAFGSLTEKVRQEPNIQVHPSVEVSSLDGNERLHEVTIRQDGTPAKLAIEGFFLALGQIPNSELARELVDLAPNGSIKADSQGRTRVPGIFAAGDVVEGIFRQLVVACGSGATAALTAEQYLSQLWDPGS